MCSVRLYLRLDEVDINLELRDALHLNREVAAIPFDCVEDFLVLVTSHHVRASIAAARATPLCRALGSHE